MREKNPEVDVYLMEGCGRCAFVGTPECKVNDWRDELVQLREIILDSGLTEELKWKQPCYTFENSNVVLMAAFREYCAVSFFKGVLLKDAEGILDSPGENSQAVRLIRFTSGQEIEEKAAVLKAFIQEAVEVEKAGLKVEFKKEAEPIPDELEEAFEIDPDFEAAFHALTPGRQRGYILHFSQPKHSRTRTTRIEKYRQQILDGKGMQDR